LGLADVWKLLVFTLREGLLGLEHGKALHIVSVVFINVHLAPEFGVFLVLMSSFVASFKVPLSFFIKT